MSDLVVACIEGPLPGYDSDHHCPPQAGQCGAYSLGMGSDVWFTEVELSGREFGSQKFVDSFLRPLVSLNPNTLLPA